MEILDYVKYMNDYFILTSDNGYKNFVLWNYSGSDKVCRAIKLLHANDRTSFPYICLYEDNGMIYLPPHNSNELFIYDIGKESFEHVAIDIPGLKGEYEPKLYTGIIDYNGYLFFVGTQRSAIIKMNKKTRIFEICMADNYHANSNLFILNKRGTACSVGNKIYLPIDSDDMICIYDMDTDKYIYKQIGDHHNRFNTIIFADDAFWLTGSKNEIIMWKENTEEVKKFDSFPREFSNDKKSGDNCVFSRVSLFYDKLYYAPLNANMVMAFDLETGSTSQIGDYIKPGNKCYTIKQLNDELLFLQIENSDFEALFDIYISKTGSVTYKNSEFTAKGSYNDFMTNIGMLAENHTLDLTFWIQNILTSGSAEDHYENDGKEIYSRLMELCNKGD